MPKLIYVLHENPFIAGGGAHEPDEVLATLTEAYDKHARRAWNAPGEGTFSININDAQYALCRQNRYVRVYLDDIETAPIHGFFLGPASITTASEEEQGGDVATFAGPGSLICLARAILFAVSYLPNGDDLGALPQDDPDGMWHWTDRPPGAILVRQLEEAIERATLDPMGLSALGPVTWNFDRHNDSNGDDWETSAGDLFKLAVLTNLYDALATFQQIGLILDMDPDFALQAWDTDQGADLSGDVVFAYGVNIRASVTQQLEPRAAVSTVLVQGDLDDDGKFVYRTIDDADAGVDMETDNGRIERGLEYHYTPTNAKLDRAGKTELRRAYRQTQSVPDIPVVDTEGATAFLDYFPGDTVMTPFGAQEIAAIGLFDRDNGEYDVVLEFVQAAPLDEVVSYLMAG